MEKRLLIAAGISLLILIAWNTLFPPPKRNAATPPAPDAAISEAATPSGEAAGTLALPAPDEALPAEPAPAVQAHAAEQVHVETALFDVLLTNEGATALEWRLRGYTTVEGKPLDVFPVYADPTKRPLGVVLSEEAVADKLDRALWQVERESIAPASDGQAGERVTFTWADGEGLTARKVLFFRADSYAVAVEVEVVDRGRRLPAALRIGPGFGAQEAASSYYYEAWVRSAGGHAIHTKKDGKHGYTTGLTVASGIEWAGLEDQYFAALMLPNGGSARLEAAPIELVRRPLVEGEEATALGEMVVALAVPDQGAELFLGPKRLDLLRAVGPGLENCVWYFDNGLLSWISHKIHTALLWLHDRVMPNYGLAIVLATVVLRVLLFPVNQFAMVNMKKTQLQMQRLQPKIKRIREKFKKQKDSDSRAAMNQEMMELYKKEGVNPMGGVTGCLPLVAQFPILIGFYGMLTVAVELRGAEFFGWIHDLSRPDPFWIMPLLMGVTMFGQQAMAMTKVKDPVQQQQQRIMMIMPVVFTIICLGLPAGLVLYWFINNLLGMGQQWLVNRQTVKLEAAHAGAGEADTPAKSEPAAIPQREGVRKAKGKLGR